jgi:hypothetical protein
MLVDRIAFNKMTPVFYRRSGKRVMAKRHNEHGVNIYYKGINPGTRIYGLCRRYVWNDDFNERFTMRKHGRKIKNTVD